jgi:hypothetical protein
VPRTGTRAYPAGRDDVAGVARPGWAVVSPVELLIPDRTSPTDAAQRVSVQGGVDPYNLCTVEVVVAHQGKPHQNSPTGHPSTSRKTKPRAPRRRVGRNPNGPPRWTFLRLPRVVNITAATLRPAPPPNGSAGITVGFVFHVVVRRVARGNSVKALLKHKRVRHFR